MVPRAVLPVMAAALPVVMAVVVAALLPLATVLAGMMTAVALRTALPLAVVPVMAVVAHGGRP